MHAHTHTHTHTKSITQLLLPSVGMLGCLALLRYSKPCAANPPGAGLVTHRRTVQVSQIDFTESKVPQRPHTARRQLSICFPSYHQASIDVTARWIVSLVDSKFPFNSFDKQAGALTTWLCCTHTRMHTFIAWPNCAHLLPMTCQGT